MTHQLHVDQKFDQYPHGLLKQYQAVLHRDVTSSDAHIYFSRPVQKWIMVRRKNGKFEVGFYAKCPCSLL